MNRRLRLPDNLMQQGMPEATVALMCLQEEANPARNAADVLIEEIDDRAPQVQPVLSILQCDGLMG